MKGRGTRKEKDMAKLKRFGEIAVDKGFCTDDQVERALKLQQEEENASEQRRLIGLILLAEGFISNAQLIEMLRLMDTEAKLQTETD